MERISLKQHTELATESYAHISYNPESRAESTINSYENELNNDFYKDNRLVMELIQKYKYVVQLEIV